MSAGLLSAFARSFQVPRPMVRLYIRALQTFLNMMRVTLVPEVYGMRINFSPSTFLRRTLPAGQKGQHFHSRLDRRNHHRPTGAVWSSTTSNSRWFPFPSLPQPLSSRFADLPWSCVVAGDRLFIRNVFEPTSRRGVGFFMRQTFKLPVCPLCLGTTCPGFALFHFAFELVKDFFNLPPA